MPEVRLASCLGTIQDGSQQAVGMRGRRCSGWREVPSASRSSLPSQNHPHETGDVIRHCAPPSLPAKTAGVAPASIARYCTGTKSAPVCRRDDTTTTLYWDGWMETRHCVHCTLLTPSSRRVGRCKSLRPSRSHQIQITRISSASPTKH